MTIARQRLADRIKEYKRKKRGGDRQRVRKRNDGFQSSIGTLLDIVAQTSSTPSRAVARRERGRAVLIALASIRTEYREALQLRYLKGLPVAAIAEHLGKTEPAIHMLCNRGLKQLRERLGDRSDYLSKS